MQNITLMSTCDILKYHKFVKSTDNVDESIKNFSLLKISLILIYQQPRMITDIIFSTFQVNKIMLVCFLNQFIYKEIDD